MARLLGEAYIAILPETDQFGPQARAQLDKDMATIHPTANVNAQLNKADVAKIATQLKAVAKANPVNIGVNLDKASAAKMVAQLDAYTKAHTIDVGAKLDMRQLAKMQTQLQAFLSGKDMEVGLQLNPAQLAKIQGTYDAFVKELNDEKVSPNFNILPALSKMAMLKSANASLTAFIQEQNARNDVNLNIMPALAKIVELKAAEASLDTQKTGSLDLTSGAGLASATQGVNSFMRALMNLSGTESDNDAVVQGMSRHYGVWGAAISALQTHIPLFGGALTALHFPNVIAQASGWHILAEAVIETLAVWGPATIAMGIFAAASYQDAKQIVGQWENVRTVMSATNTPMDGLTTGLTKLSQALKPDIWSAFGAGLVAIESSSGKLTAPLESIAHLFDVLGAHIDQLVGNGGGAFSKFIQGGSNDIHELGEAFGNVGKILMVFFESVPGYATILLHLGTDFLGAAADVLQFIQPLIKVGLAVHGAIFYLGLASTLVLGFGRSALSAGATVAATGEKVEGTGSKIANLGTGLGNLVGGFVRAGSSAINWGKNLYNAGGAISEVTGGSRIAGMGLKLLGDAGAVVADVPIAGWAIAAAAAIGVGLYFALRSTTDAIQKMGQALVASIQNSNPNTLFTNTTNAVIKTGQAIESLTNSYNKLAKAQTSALSVGPYTPVKGQKNTGPYGGGSAPGPNSQPVYQPAPASEISEYVTNLQNIAKAATPAAQNELAVAKATGSMSNAISIATALGIKWSDINKATPAQLATIIQEMDNYTKAIAFMSNSQGQAASNMAAMNFAASAQMSNVQKLNSAWSTYISTVEGGEAAFVPFEQGVQQFAKDAKVAGASMDGLNSQSLTLRSDFQSVFSGAQSQISALVTYTAATGGATAAQKNLANQGIKAVIAQLVPMAGANESARAGIVALAQRANGSITSWSALTKWLGPKGAAGAAQTLQRVNGTLATSIQNVVSVANALTGAMQATAIAAQDKLVFALDGGAKAMTNFGQALASSNGKLTTASVLTGTKYYDALVKSGVGAETARQMVLSMAQSLGMNGTALTALNADLIANQKQLDGTATAAKNVASAAKAAGTAFSNLATGPLKLTTTQVQALWNNIKQQDLDSVSGKALNSKQAFLNFAENGLHFSTTKAQELWNELKQQGLDTLANKAGTTKDQFVNLAKNGLGLTTSQADNLWKELRLQYLDTIAQKGDAAKTSFINLAKNGLDLTTSQANTLWNTLRNQYLDTLSQKAGETELAFVNTAKQFGLTTTAAETLWGQLKNLSGGSPYNVDVEEVLSGTGSVSAKISAASVVLSGGAGVITPKAANPKTNPQIGAKEDITVPKAAGGYVAVGGHHSNTDSVPIMAKPNELIIPAEHAPNIAQHMANQGHKLPGFSVGGFVANAGTVANNAVGATNTVISDVKQFAQQMTSQFSSDVSGAFENAQSAAAAGSAYGGPSSFGGGFESLAALVSFARYFMQNGMNRAAAAGMAATISGEEDSAGPESRNCVPLTYKVVTTRGVLSHDEVLIGDQTVGYNLETGQEEIATILDVPYHYDATMCRIGNERWHAVCTVDHKWITAERGLVRADRLRMGERVLLDENWSEQVFDFERLDNADTFCLTTTTGTWTTLTEEGDVIWTGNSSGFGLIGWTGNTVGLPAGYTGPTGNVAYDLKEQLAGVIGYMNARGGPGPLNAAGNPVAAGDVWSRYEAPASALSDTRPAIANEIYAALGASSPAAATAAIQTQKQVTGKVNQVKPFSAGGTVSEPVIGFGVNSGTPYSFGENGPEMVNPGMDTSANDNYMQPMTSAQAQTVISLLTTLTQQGQALPYNLTKVQQNGLGAGMRSKR
jgi:hypothetical protein